MYHELTTAHYFTALETLLPVNDFRVLGVHVWPLLRTELHTRLINRILDAVPPPVIESIDGMGKAIMRERMLPHADKAFEPPVPPRPQAALSPAPSVFLTRFDEHYRKTSDGCYAPILDSWYDHLLGLGRGVKVEIMSDGYMTFQPRLNPSLALPAPDAALMERAYGAILDDGIKDIVQLLELVISFSLSRFALDLRAEKSELATAFVTAYAHKLAFDPVLDSLRPTDLFLTSFYYAAGMGVLWSCQDRGVRSIELQHCINGENQPPYTHWTGIPPDGYAMLPDVFLTWGGISANNIHRWLPRNGHPHQVMVGGRPDLAKVTADDPMRDHMAGLCQGRGRVILVSLDLKAMEPVLIETMRRAPADWLWVLRSHPWSDAARLPGACPDDVNALLLAEGITNFEIHASTRAYLPTVLQLSDHHVTRISTVALEAFCFDVPTTFIFPSAKDLYRTYLNAQRSYYADTPGEIIASIEQGWSGLAADGPTDIVVDKDVPRRVLSALLGDRRSALPETTPP